MATQARGAGQGRTGGHRDRQAQGLMTRGAGSRGMARRDPMSELVGQPFGLLRRLTEDLDRVFGLPVTAILADPSAQGAADFEPNIDVIRRGNELVVRADLPGVPPDAMTVTINEDAIVIEGEREDVRDDTQGDVYVRERHVGRFLRTIPLPEDVNADEARAAVRDGGLEIVIPLSEQARERQGRRLQINEGGSQSARTDTAASESSAAAARTAGAGGAR